MKPSKFKIFISVESYDEKTAVNTHSSKNSLSANGSKKYRPCSPVNHGRNFYFKLTERKAPLGIVGLNYGSP